MAMLILDDVDAHAPEGGKGKQGGVELRQLLPAQGETVACNDRKNDQRGKQCHGDDPDEKVQVKQLFPEFFERFYCAQPLSCNVVGGLSLRKGSPKAAPVPQ